MYSKLLVALDGSELSEGILPYARSFAKTLDIPVELLHVVDPDHFLYSVFAHHGRYYDIMTAEKKRSIDYLSKIATSFSDSVSVDCSVKTGNPADVICRSSSVARRHLDRHDYPWAFWDQAVALRRCC